MPNRECLNQNRADANKHRIKKNMMPGRLKRECLLSKPVKPGNNILNQNCAPGRKNRECLGDVLNKIVPYSSFSALKMFGGILSGNENRECRECLPNAPQNARKPNREALGTQTGNVSKVESELHNKISLLTKIVVPSQNPAWEGFLDFIRFFGHIPGIPGFRSRVEVFDFAERSRSRVYPIYKYIGVCM